MNSPAFLLTLSLFVTTSIFNQNLSAQQNFTVSLSGAKMRAPLDVPPGSNLVSLCNLTPGNTYMVVANGAAYGQQATFNIAAFSPLSTAAKDFSFVADRDNAIRFTALSECVGMQVQADSPLPVSSIPMFLSVRCESCPEANAWKEKMLGKAGMSVLSVNDGVSAEDLVKNVLVGGDCYNVSNVTFSGHPEQIGTFSGGLSNIGFSNGMMLATGDVNIAPGPNDLDNASGGFGSSTPDQNLSSLTSGSIYDRADIEFDFTPTQTPVTFEYVFASEEYCEYVNKQYNDVFGFFISGPGITGTKNIALVPNTNTPITINTVNHLTNSGYYIHNTGPFGINCGLAPSLSPSIFEVQYDGFTQKLTAVANVIPCQKYHIKLKIADVADGIYDSAVFLRANSFAAGGNVIAESVYPAGLQHVYENCDTGYIRFERSNGNAAQPLAVNFTVSGASAATPGLDYLPLTSPVVIPAGQSELLVPVVILPDTLTEGQENILLLLDNSCACTQTEINFFIQDNSVMGLNLDDAMVCTDAGATLSPLATGGAVPYSYLWNTGETTPAIFVNPSQTTRYSVVVTDNCGQAVTDTALVSVQPLTRDTVSIPFCPGSSVTLGGITYTSSATVTEILPGMNGGCDTVVTYALQLLSNPVFSDTIAFCPGDSVVLGGVVYKTPGVVTDTLPSANGVCSAIVHHTLHFLTPASSTVTAGCPASIVLPDATQTKVNYDLPLVSSDCPCPGISLVRTEGPASGSIFPIGTTRVCYTATDSCGQTASCCFEVKVPETPPCDIKTIGCIKYELLGISKDPAGNRTYSIRVTNNCANKLIYTAFQVPDGVIAVDPPNNSLYTAPGGHAFEVLNPNYSPFYSVRFKSLTDSLFNGASDVFEYTLPPYSAPKYIHVIARLTPQLYYEAHLNTYYCPETNAGSGEKAGARAAGRNAGFAVFPNPTAGSLYADMTDWTGEQVELRLFDSRGQLVQEYTVIADDAPQELPMKQDLPDGLYFLERTTKTGAQQAVRFVVRR